MLELTAGIVTYNSDLEMLKQTVSSFNKCQLNKKIFIHDNQSQNEYRQKLNSLEVDNIFDGPNKGFGFGHNQITKQIDNSKYHLVLNPDVEILPGTLEEMINYMNKNSDIGLMTPKILNSDKTLQALNKRPPSLFNLFARRFLPKPLQSWSPIKQRMDHYIMLDKGYDSNYEVPYMSGCFMLFRTEVLQKIKGFDERFFMYLEDADVTRKAAVISKCMYYSQASIIHHWNRGSHKSLKLTWISIKSSLKYFNKWGWSIF